MSAPLLHGDLKDRLLPAVLGEILRRGLNGRLELRHGDQTLLELRVAGPRVAAAQGDTVDQVRGAAAREDGAFRLLPGPVELPSDAPALANLVLIAARALPRTERVEAALGSLDAPLAVTERGRRGVSDVQLSAEEAFLLSRVDGRASVREVCQLSPVGEEATLRSIYGLTAAGLLRLSPRRSTDVSSRAGSAARRTDPLSKLEGFLERTSSGESGAAAASRRGPKAGAMAAGASGTDRGTASGSRPGKQAASSASATERAAPRSGSPGGKAAPAAAAVPTRERIAPPTPERARLEERLRLAERQNFYELLGVPENASSDEIRMVYYALARRFHPDRFHRPEVRDLQPALEKLFGRMTEAYQLLRDADGRQEYDRRLHAGKLDGRKVQQAAVKELARENFRRGSALVAKGQFVKALPFLEQAGKADDACAEHLELLGAVQTLNPRFKVKALANLRRTTELAPSEASGWLLLGLHYAKYNHDEEAKRALKQAVSWDNGCEAARIVLKALEGTGDRPASQGATEMLRQILKKG